MKRHLSYFIININDNSNVMVQAWDYKDLEEILNKSGIGENEWRIRSILRELPMDQTFNAPEIDTDFRKYYL